MQKYLSCAIVLVATLLLPGCNPTYNWRDYSSPDASYRVLFPSKAATHAREVDLNGMKVEITMTAAEVEGVTFAVGSGAAPDAARAQAALADMATALVRNLGATVLRQSASAAAQDGASSSSIDIDAAGSANGQPMKLRGHFAAKGKRFYQVIVVGPAKAVSPEQTDQFMSSFRLQ